MPSTLRRTKTMPAQTPSAAGRSRRAVTARASSKAARAKTKSAAAAKRAVKTRTREAYAAATHAVMDLKEEKYFEVAGDLQSHPDPPAEGAKRCSVKAFVTTSNLDPADGTTVENYCGNPIVNLQMVNPFKSTNASPALAAYALDGKYCYPTQNAVAWQINRIYARLGEDMVNANGSYPPNNTLNDPLLVDQCPVRCRIIRVTPKLAPGITTAIDPSTDLFINQVGEPYSPNDPTFSYTDCEFAAVNNRRYTVLSDLKFTLVTPFTGSWNHLRSSDTQGWFIQQPMVKASGASTKKLVTKHQLTQKKGGSLYYEQPNTNSTTNATTGQRREYIFMHFWYETNDGGGDKPSLGGNGIVPNDNQIKIHWRTESRFKDA